MWVVYALISPLCNSVTHLYDRYLEVSKVHHFAVLMWLFYVAKMLMVLTVLLFVNVGSTEMGRSLVVGSLNAVSVMAFFIALNQDEVSRITPLWLLTPLFVFGISYFTLPQILSTTQAIAFAFLVAGGIIMAAHKMKEIIRPNKTFWLMVLSCLALAFSEVLSKTLYVTQEYWATFTAIRVGELAFSTSLLLICFGLNQKSIRESMQASRNKRALMLVAFVELIGVLGVASHEYALKIAPVSLVSILNVTSPVFVFLITATFWRILPPALQEDHTRAVILQKSIGLVFMALGVGMLIH